ELSVEPLCAAAAVPGGLAPMHVATAGLLEALGQRLLGLRAGDLPEVGIHHEPPPWRGGLGLADGHQAAPPKGLPWEKTPTVWGKSPTTLSRRRETITPRPPDHGRSGSFDLRRLGPPPSSSAESVPRCGRGAWAWG